MRPSLIAVAALVVSLSIVPDVDAQFASIQPGSRVRLTTKNTIREPVVFVVDHVSADTLFFKDDVGVVRPMVTADAIDRLDVSRREFRPTWSKAAPLWLPLVSGAALGTFGYVTDEEGDFFSPEDSFVLGAAFGAVVGLVVGTWIAIGNRADEWENVPVSASEKLSHAKPSLYVSPSTRGVTLGVGLRF